jgi:HPt (histidine-containing phosphotransfer) domain-containing protein
MAAIEEAILRGLIDDMGGEMEVVKELIQSYLEEAPKLLAEARSALGAKDAPGVQRAVHTLKSTSATFGAMSLSVLSKEVEQAARGGVLPSDDQMAGLEAGFASARAELVKRL